MPHQSTKARETGIIIIIIREAPNTGGVETNPPAVTLAAAIERVLHWTRRPRSIAMCVCVCGKSSSRTIFSATYFSVRGGTDPRRFRPDVLLDVRDHGGACSNHLQEHHSHISTHAAPSLIRWVCSLAFLFCPFGYFPPEIRYEKNDRQRWGWKT